VRTAPISRARIAAIAALTSVGALVLAPATSFAFTAVPKAGGSPNADAIQDLYIFALIIGVIVLIGVEALLVRSLLKFRASKGAVADNHSSDGKGDLGWAIGATVIVVLLAVATFVKLPDVTNPPNGVPVADFAKSSATTGLVSIPSPADGKKLTINVTGRQFIWRYTYGDRLDSPFVYTEMVAPSDTVVVLKIQSTDVIHSWWIPELGGKFDAVPGSTNYTWFKAPTPKGPNGDVYSGQSAQLGGRQFANMLATVRIVTPAAFKVWLASQKQRIADANQQAIKNRSKLAAQGQIPNLTPAQ
jgi:cytochrome c oxidase subunit 2